MMSLLAEREGRRAVSFPLPPLGDLRGLEVYAPGARRAGISLPHGSQKAQGPAVAGTTDRSQRFHGCLFFASHAFLAAKHVLVRNLDGLAGGEGITFVLFSPYSAEWHRLPFSTIFLCRNYLRRLSPACGSS